MNIKIKIFIPILICLIPFKMKASTEVLQMEHKQSEQTISYLPIISYQKSLLEKINNLLMNYFYKESEAKKIITIALKQNLTKPENKDEKECLTKSRDEALDEIKETTTKIFDLNDNTDLSSHLETMKDLSKNLDPKIDEKTINAIHFLLENQHRSSIVDTLFWLKSAKEMDLHNVIPMTEETAKKSKVEILGTLRKKMAKN
jgi:hypothetical protein